MNWDNFHKWAATIIAVVELIIIIVLFVLNKPPEIVKPAESAFPQPARAGEFYDFSLDLVNDGDRAPRVYVEWEASGESSTQLEQKKCDSTYVIESHKSKTATCSFRVPENSRSIEIKATIHYSSDEKLENEKDKIDFLRRLGEKAFFGPVEVPVVNNESET